LRVRPEVAIRAHEGLVFHAATGAVSVKARADSGCRETASTAANSGSTSAAKRVGEVLDRHRDVGGGLVRSRHGEGRADERVGEARAGEAPLQLAEALALLQRASGQVDQRLDQRLDVVLSAGDGDDGAAVGVPDQDHGAPGIARSIEAM
jgi:hypothetical protein